MDVDGQVVEALVVEMTEEVGEERAARGVDSREHRLGPIPGEFAQAGSVTSAEDHGFHGEQNDSGIAR